MFNNAAAAAAAAAAWNTGGLWAGQGADRNFGGGMFPGHGALEQLAAMQAMSAAGGDFSGGYPAYTAMVVPQQYGGGVSPFAHDAQAYGDGSFGMHKNLGGMGHKGPGGGGR